MLCRDELYDRRCPFSSVNVASLPMPRRSIDDPPPTLTPLVDGTFAPTPGFCPPPKFCGMLRTTSPRFDWPEFRISSALNRMTGDATEEPRIRLPVTTMSDPSE